MSGKKKNQLQAAKETHIALKYRQQLRDECLATIREEATQLFETWKTARCESRKQTKLWNDTLNAEIENTLKFIDKIEETLDNMQNVYSPGLNIDEEAIIAHERSAMMELMERYRPAADLSPLEEKFAKLAVEPDDSKELIELANKVVSEHKEELERLKDEKREFEEKLAAAKEQSEKREVRSVADRLLLERKKKKCTDEIERIRAKQLEMQKKDEAREKALRESEEVIEGLKTEIAEYKKIVEDLK